MTEHEQELGEIAGGEMWLSRMLPAAESVETERIKMRVRLEAGERWLSGHLQDSSSRGPAEAVRGRVRGALLEAGAVAPLLRRSFGPARRWFAAAGATVGLAAALAIVVTGVKYVGSVWERDKSASENPLTLSSPPVGERGWETLSNSESADSRIGERDLVALSAFEQSTQAADDVDKSLQALEKEIADLGQFFVGRGGDGEPNSVLDGFWDSRDSSDMDGEGADQPVGAAWRIRESGV